MRQFPNRRTGARTTVNWPAVLLSGLSRVPCAVVDVSVGGAKLDVSSDIPEEAYVIVVCTKFGSLEGRIAWRKGPYAGVKFTDARAAASLRPFVRMGADPTFTATVKFGRRRPA